MNRRRHPDPRPNTLLYAAYIAMFMCVVVGACGGILHAFYCNEQVRIEREIAKTRERIEEHRLDIQMIQVRKERELDRYEIRAQLELYDSPLVAVGHGVVEKVDSITRPDGPPVALRRP
jgi:folate-binding Fe-S cluster repair protein YgfZ